MTKRILSILVAVLMVMALIPMSALAANADSNKAGKPVEQNKAAKPAVSKTAAVTFDFEYSSESEFDWTLVDSDGDGYDWYWLGYNVNQTTANMAYEGIGNLTSASYMSVALTPDNWAITPAVEVPEDATELTFYIGGQDPSWADEHYAVYAGITPNVTDMEEIMAESVTTGAYVQQTIDISEYAGETVYFGFRHFNVTDMFRINLDLVEIHSEGEPVEPVVTDEPIVTDPPTPIDPPAEGNATVILNVPEDHWQDGTGYQMLLDADATAYGTIIPETGGLTTSGNASDAVYAEFEYKIPENADGALTTANIVSCTSVAIEIPAGVYDWCITNPTPGDRMWIASAQGNVGGRYDDYEFLAGNTYEFVVTLQGSNDAVNVTITGENVPEVPSLNEALNVEGGTLEFTTDAAYPWTVVGTGANAYAKAGNTGIASSTSTLTLNVTAEAGDTLTFDFKAWGEGSYTYYDHCDFIVNGATEFTYGAYDNEWETYTYTCAEAGDYEFVWSYTKDSSVNPTGDYFAVDEVAFNGEGTPVVTEEPGEPTEGFSVIWDFETDPIDQGWQAADADGDGFSWEWMYGADYASYSHEGSGFYTSASYINDYGALYPDNWAITPAVEIADLSAATFSFWYAGQDASWAGEHFAVYAGNTDNIDDMVQIADEVIVAAKVVGTYRQIEINLADADIEPGTVYFAVRHFNCTDMFRLNIDDAMVVVEGTEPGPGESEEPIPDTALINEIRVYGFETPVRYEEAGAHLNLTVPEDAYYEIEEAYWWDDDNWNRLVDDDVFEEGGHYSVVVKVVPFEGSTFEQKVRFFADDSTETIDWDYTERETDTVAWLVVLPLEAGMSDLDKALNVEDGDIHFTTGGNYPWVTDYEGDRFYAHSSNNGVASTSSTVSAVIEAVEGDVVMFDFKAWGEGSYTYWDHCDFAIDNTVVATYGAYDNDWEVFKYELTPGTHTLTWSYTKDSSVNPTGDYYAVDEVYVGEPIPVEAIECEDITIYMYESEAISYTVLPERAWNTEVTFVSDDPTIAAVDENGIVYGVNEGETFVTITSVENPEVYAVCSVTVLWAPAPTVIHGIAGYDPSDETSDMWFRFFHNVPSNVAPISNAPSSYAAAYIGGEGLIYGVTTDGSVYVCEVEVGEDMFGLPAVTAVSEPEILAEGVTDWTVVSMTYDNSISGLFGIAVDDNSVFHLVGINTLDGALYELAELPFDAFVLASDGEGTAYTIEFGTGDLYMIDLESYDYVFIGSTGYDVAYVQDMCYDPEQNLLYWAQYAEDSSALVQIDPETAEIVDYGPIGAEGTETVAMFVLNDDTISDVPAEYIELVPEEAEVYVGGTKQFAVRYYPFNATVGRDVTWSVDDEEIISVEDGLVTGINLGVASVIATLDNGYEASAVVTVIAPPVVGWYFEEDPEVEGWQFIDADGDYMNWEWYMGYPDQAYEGEGYITSYSYDNSWYEPLYPDDWAISPAVEIPNANAKVTLYAKGQDPDWAEENFAIFVGLTDDIYDMVQVSDEVIVTGEYIKYEADLSEFAGQTAYIAIRHFNCTDMFRINVDQVEVWGKNMLWGDANGDGVVDTVDVLELMRYVQGTTELDPENLIPWCDVNLDHVIDFTDALLILRYVLELIPEIPTQPYDPATY